MGKKRKAPKPRIHGPYLESALICEDVIRDKHDGLNSLIRVVNSVKVQVDQPVPHGSLLQLPLILFVSFRAGNFTGPCSLLVKMLPPSGKSHIGAETPEPLRFGGGDTGIFFRVPIFIAYGNDGTYWIEVYVNKKLYTKIPLTVQTEVVNVEEQKGGD